MLPNLGAGLRCVEPADAIHISIWDRKALPFRFRRQRIALMHQIGMASDVTRLT
jgi:hypothetical protein